ncbi:MAG: ParA family protein [Candidatus Fermentibacteraceae bacterium]|nr:ParA family protein [Candidatus Fermentibacteraceae bacterium]
MNGTRIMAIANQKGGVGKTTTAINLGASLAMNDREVLIVDFDPQINATAGLGVEERSGNDISSLLLGEKGLQDIIRTTSVDGLRLIPGSRGLSGLEIELATAEFREFLLREALEDCLDRFDFVLIDCPPSLGLLTINALVAASEVLVTLQSEYYALEGLSHLMDTIRNVNRLWNPGLQISGVVLTMFDQRLILSRDVEEEVRGFLGAKLCKTYIPRNVKLSEAPSYGMPVLLYDAKSRGAISYLSLAREVMNR